MRHAYIIAAVLCVGTLAAGGVLFAKENNIDLFAREKKVSVHQIQPITDALSNIRYEKSATADFADTIARELIQNNPEGPIADSKTSPAIKGVDPNIFANNFLASDMERVTKELLNIVPPEPVVSSSGNSADAFERYIKERNAIILKGNAIFDGIKIPSEFDEATLRLMADANEKTFNELARLTVPIKAKDLHREELRLRLLQQTIYEKILAYRTDPLSATVAITLLERVSAEEEAFRKDFAVFVQMNSNTP